MEVIIKKLVKDNKNASKAVLFHYAHLYDFIDWYLYIGGWQGPAGLQAL